MQRSCKQCGVSFTIDDRDRAFYDKVSPLIGGKKLPIPPPTFCPDCRQQRRAAFRNEWTLYRRHCDRCKKSLVAIYPEQTPFPVYCNGCWWSDQWDPLLFGQDFDASRPFFDQWRQLRDRVPRMALYLKNAENSDYCNHSESLKNCYLCVSTGGSENVYYSEWIINNCRDLCDCYQLEDSELCYDSLYSVGNYNCISVYLSDQCRDSAFLFDCKGCHHCFLCSNLQHKEYCIENRAVGREEYEQFLRSVDLHSYGQYEHWHTKFLEMLRRKAIHKFQHIIYCDGCSGDLVYKCRNVHDSYDVINSQDCRYCYYAGHQKDSYDVYESAFNCELQYDTHACNRGTRVIAGTVSYDVDDVAYVDSCHNSGSLFGCVGLKRKKYCILNRQYGKEEYEELVSRIVDVMQSQGAWGEFFPVNVSPFAYNETMAMHFLPITREEAVKRGWRWKDDIDVPPAVSKIIDAADLPDRIDDIPDDILHWAIRCTVSGRPFLIVKQELDFYRRQGLPAPRLHPDERWKRRLALRNPRKLWKRTCTNCGTAIESTYQPSRPEIVYCEECYTKAVYE